uniref:Protein-tyrosine phosphatase n=1 Tax=Panagrellus redivivus TaxID=6233 RepID=A0A7E4VFW2_PANRE
MRREKTPRRSRVSNSTGPRRRKSERRIRHDDDNLAAEAVKARMIRSSKAATNNNVGQAKNRSCDENETEKTETVHQNVKSVVDRDRPISPLQKQRFEDFTRDAVNKGVQGILEEYQIHLKPYVPVGITKKAFDANPKKNRYADVVCIDGTRVILKNHTTDYIHANFVRGEPLMNGFICTQGPMMDTVKDFWKMVSQEHVGNIIMLCDTVEQGKEKCNQYWPREEGCTVEWQGIQVRNIKVDNSDSTTVVSTLELVYDRKDKIVIKHHHWRTWPDKSVPQSVLAPFRLLRNVRHSQRPTVVHCSAGIGRTGSVVALEMCYQQLLAENKLNVLDIVKLLRHMRMHAVQTDLQYLYLFKCLLTFSQKHKTIPGDCSSKLEQFDRDYQVLIDAKMAEEKPEAYAPLQPLKLGKFAPIP